MQHVNDGIVQNTFDPLTIEADPFPTTIPESPLAVDIVNSPE